MGANVAVGRRRGRPTTTRAGRDSWVSNATDARFNKDWLARLLNTWSIVIGFYTGLSPYEQL